MGEWLHSTQNNGCNYISQSQLTSVSKMKGTDVSVFSLPRRTLGHYGLPSLFVGNIVRGYYLSTKCILIWYNIYPTEALWRSDWWCGAVKSKHCMDYHVQEFKNCDHTCTDKEPHGTANITCREATYTLRTKQNGCHYTDDIFEYIFFMKKYI